MAIVVFLLAGCWFISRRTWLARALALGAWFLFGAFLIQIRGRPRADPRLIDFSGGQSVTLTAHVLRGGYAHSVGLHSTTRSIDVESEEIEDDSESLPVRAGIRLSLYDPEENQTTTAETETKSKTNDDRSDLTATRNTANAANQPGFAPIPTPDFTYGERLRIRAKLHPPRNFRDPGAFDYEGYLRDNGISLLGSAPMANVERLPGFSGNRVALWRARVHASIIAKIHHLWPAPQAMLMDAMVLGEESFLRNSTRTEFQRSGTYHLLVVSGMNLSILAVAIFWTLRRFRLDPALAAVATVAASFAYAFVVGVGPPVWRAALMLAIYLGARLLYRGRNMLNAIGAAAIGVLIADPDALFGASFQLTFLAVFIIAGIGEPLLERSLLPYARGLRSLQATSYDLHLLPKVAQLRLDLRLIGGRLSRFIGKRLGRTLPGFAVRVVIGLTELVFISTLMQVGLALAHGLLLPSRHHHGHACQSSRDTTHADPDASCRGRGWPRIFFSHAGEACRLDLRICPARNYGDGALAWRHTNSRFSCRLARGHAIDCNNPDRASVSGAGNAGRAQGAHRRSRVSSIAGRRLFMDCIRSGASSSSRRRH